jgi:hypothetical protein
MSPFHIEPKDPFTGDFDDLVHERAVLAERVSTLAELLDACRGAVLRDDDGALDGPLIERIDQALAGLGADPATQETT